MKLVYKGLTTTEKARMKKELLSLIKPSAKKDCAVLDTDPAPVKVAKEANQKKFLKMREEEVLLSIDAADAGRVVCGVAFMKDKPVDLKDCKDEDGLPREFDEKELKKFENLVDLGVLHEIEAKK